MSDAINMDIGKLGFGLMRLPKKGLGIDIEQTSVMVDKFLEAGFTYFDTAHVYPGSEVATKKALVDRHPRESYTLATKLFATTALTEKMAKSQFETSLERTGAGYIDYYLMHTLMSANYKKYDKFHLWDFAFEEKAKGRIKHVGFSFHDGPELLDEILTTHPEAEFVQLQINYADWENKNVTSRANYEVARKHGKPIVVMEPVKGGSLANPPKAVKEIFDRVNPGVSYASWAIRFVASLDGILAVLSGMSNVEQMEDNISYMKDFKKLSEEEWAAINEAQKILKSSAIIPCTSCKYCVEGCPKQIAIPDMFSAMNKQLGSGQLKEAREDYAAITETSSRASDCIKCKKCESVCPQHIDITNQLENVAKVLE
ncbi:MAG: aldo/keto reductase [Lachnospiraceae bacterium]|nr:aldo/keto reductase [Lachnospiraceae bacterium]